MLVQFAVFLLDWFGFEHKKRVTNVEKSNISLKKKKRSIIERLKK